MLLQVRLEGCAAVCAGQACILGAVMLHFMRVFVTVLSVQGQAVFIPSAGLEAGDGPGLATMGVATGETVKRTLLPR